MTLLFLLALPFLPLEPTFGLPGEVMEIPGAASPTGTLVPMGAPAPFDAPMLRATSVPLADTLAAAARTRLGEAAAEGTQLDTTAAEGTQLDAAAVVGTRGWGGDAHLFGGLVLGAHRGDYGGAATLLVGGGNDHRSFLVGGGPSAELAEIRGVGLRSWIGVGHLRERLLNDRAPGGREAATRSVTGPMVTISLRRPLGPGSLTAQAGFLTGRSDGPEFVRSPWVHTTRFTLGFGW